MYPEVNNPGHNCFVFSSQTLPQLQSDAVKAPFATAKLRRKETKSAGFFSHICSPAGRNARSGAAAVIGAALGQVDDLSPFGSPRFGL